MNTTNIKSYSELMLLKTFEERYEYLRLDGIIGEYTFGSHRYLNQKFYNTPEWRKFRNEIIVRDNGCDMGLAGYDIYGRIHVHHINPITIDEVVNNTPSLFDPENVVCVSLGTHNAIHYGDESLLFVELVERKPNDTRPWRQ